MRHPSIEEHAEQLNEEGWALANLNESYCEMHILKD